jgi:molybdenum cofactor biosynthesis protein MoaC
MVNITHKQSTHRKAIAQAIVRVSKQETIDAIINKQVPKGDVFEMAKVAGLFAAKRTSDMIPDCHPLPIEHASVAYEIEELTIKVLMTIETIYKTGVEVEAMHAASVVALTIYDMLKPLDKNISIEQIKLIEKKGGKSDFTNKETQTIKAAVVVCSDSIFKGTHHDEAGKAIIEKLKNCGIVGEHYEVIPDEKDLIQEKVKHFNTQHFDLLIFTGGTGLSPRDVTTEALAEIIDRRIPGVEEAMRTYGQQRTPYAMLSRSVAGYADKLLVLGLPGSTRGAAESMDAIFPHLLHLFRVAKGNRHE